MHPTKTQQHGLCSGSSHQRMHQPRMERLLCCGYCKWMPVVIDPFRCIIGGRLRGFTLHHTLNCTCDKNGPQSIHLDVHCQPVVASQPCSACDIDLIPESRPTLSLFVRAHVSLALLFQAIYRGSLSMPSELTKIGQQFRPSSGPSDTLLTSHRKADPRAIVAAIPGVPTYRPW